nr:MAG TPA: hypothetical protein [Caudoviricetes sp.]
MSSFWREIRSREYVYIIAERELLPVEFYSVENPCDLADEANIGNIRICFSQMNKSVPVEK